MPIRRRQHKRTSAPQGLRRVDWANPITRGLAQCVVSVGGRPIQVVGTGLSVNGTIGVQNTRHGPAYTNNAEAVTGSTALNFLSLPVTQSAVTVLYVGGRNISVGGSQVAIALATRSGSDSTGFEIALGNSFGDANLLYWSIQAGEVNPLVWVDGAKAAGNNPTNVTISNRRVYSIVASVAAHSVGSGHTVLAKAAGTGDYALDVFCNLYAQWNRQLTEAEHASLSANPWQIFAPEVRHFLASAAGGPITQAITQATETDTAQALTVVAGQSVAIGQATETDTARPLVAAQSLAIGRAVESNAAQALAAAQSRSITRAEEADTAQALTAAQTRTIARAEEADAAQAVTTPGVQSVAIGLALEIDAAGLLASSQALGIARATEADQAQPLTAAQARAISPALEADTAQALQAVVAQVLAIGRASEANTAQSVTAVGGAVAPGATAEEIWSYVLPTGLSAADTVSQIHAMLTALTGGAVELPVNVVKMNSAPVVGTGASGDPWRGA